MPSISSKQLNISWKQPVRAASTVDIPALSGLLTVDGVTLASGDRVLVKDQAAPATNGVYVAAAGAWIRATDFLTGGVFAGAGVLVTSGTQAQQLWSVVTAGAIVVGVTPLSFSSVGSAGALAGDVTGPLGTNHVSAIQGVGAPTLADAPIIAGEGAYQGAVAVLDNDVLSSPRCLVADGSFLYVGQSSQITGLQLGTVLKLEMSGKTVVSVATLDLTTIEPTVTSIRDLAQDATYLYAATWDGAHVVIIDKATFTVAGWAYAGPGRLIPSVTVDATSIYAVAQSPNRVLKWSVAACLGQPPATVLPSANGSFSGRQIRWGDYNGGTLWLAAGNQGVNAITEIDPATLAPLRTLAELEAGVSPFCQHIIQAFGYVWATGGPDKNSDNAKLYRIDLSGPALSVTATLTTGLPINGFVGGLTMGPDPGGTPDQWLYLSSMFGEAAFYRPVVVMADPVGAAMIPLTMIMDESCPRPLNGNVAAIGDVTYLASAYNGTDLSQGIEFYAYTAFPGQQNQYGVIEFPPSLSKLTYRSFFSGDVIGPPNNSRVRGMLGYSFTALQPTTGGFVQFGGSSWDMAFALGGFGNVCLVDPLLGNDLTGSFSGAPFQTIQAALNVAGGRASASAPVTVWVMPGIYREDIVIPSYVTLISITSSQALTASTAALVGGLFENATSPGTVIAGKNAPTTPTGGEYNIVTLRPFASIQGVAVKRTIPSTLNCDYSVNGIKIEQGPSALGPSSIKDVAVVIDAFLQGPGGSALRGIYAYTGFNSSEAPTIIENCHVRLRVAATGSQYGTDIALDSAGSYFKLVNNHCAITSTLGWGLEVVNGIVGVYGGDYGGIPSIYRYQAAQVTLYGVTVAGEVPQPFPTGNSAIFGPTIAYGSQLERFMQLGAMSAGTTYLTPQGSSASAIFYQVPAIRHLRSISVRVSAAPGSGTDQWQIVHNNVFPVGTVTLSNAATSAQASAPFTFVAGETFTIKQTKNGNSTAADPVVTLEWY